MKEIKTYKNNGVEWVGTPYQGFGYRDTDAGTIGLIRCPLCGKENYAMNVSSGICTWCPFNANEKHDE